MATREKSGVHLTGADSGWPVGAAGEPGPNKDGTGANDAALPKVASVAANVIVASREVQRVELRGGDANSTFKLTFDGQQTSALNRTTLTAAQLQTALEALSNIAPGDVAVTGPTGGPYEIEFLEAGAYGDTDVPELTAQPQAVNEVQTVTITGTPTGGTFTLTFEGRTTAAIAYNANAAAVESALEALDNLAPADVGVSGGPGPGTPYVVTFTGARAGKDQPAITAAHAFTGGTSPTIAVTETTKGVTPPTVAPSTYAAGS